MPKRPHSPALDSVLSVKYAHTQHVDHPNHFLVQNFDSILSDETVLTIFGFLGAYHLCLVRAVNKHWNRLATDNHLWRVMFLREFSLQRLRGSRGFSQHAHREIRPLPSRVLHEGDETSIRDVLPENYTDWRWMYRISSNWSRGRCAVAMQRAYHQYLASGSSLDAPSAAFPSQSSLQDPLCSSQSAAHLLLVGDLTIYASSQLSTTPTVYIFRDSIDSGLSIPHQAPPNTHISITALSLDHSSANLRLAIFYSDGTWAIYSVDYERRDITLLYNHPIYITLSSLAVVQAAYHHPLLVTLTSKFRMSIFYLPPTPASAILKHTLWSYTGFSPLTMTLSRYRTPDQYRVLLAHSAPIYPEHWAPSATDITLSTAETSDPTAIKILSSASTNNNLPVGWIPDGTPDGIPEELRLRWARKVSHVSGIQTDGKFVVFASEDGSIQVYRLHRNAKLFYERTLFPPAHAPSPRALSVADSRCVCATRDGGLWVWDLESGVGVQAASIYSMDTSSEVDEDGDDAMLGSAENPSTIVRVAFDARRIVAADTSGAIQIYNFDI